MQGVITGAPCLEGDLVGEQDVLCIVRSGRQEGEILAPFAGTVTRLHFEQGDSVAVGSLLADLRPTSEDGPTAGAAARAIGRWAPRFAALAAAAAALLVPLLWLTVTLLASLAVVGARDIAPRPRRTAAAHVLALPRVAARAARWCGQALINRPLPALLRTIYWLIASLVAPAAIGAGLWLAADGTDGLLAAARAATYDHAVRIFAFLVCFWLTRRFFATATHKQRLGRAARRLPQAATLAIGVAILTGAIASATVMPYATWAPGTDHRSFTALLPEDATAWIDRQRADWAAAQVRGATACLRENGRGDWADPAVKARPDGTLVASVRTTEDSPIGDRSLGTLMLATQNQLEPHQATVVIHTGVRARVRFEVQPGRRPIRDIDRVLELASATETASARLTGVREVTDTDVRVALRCSAARP